MTVLQRCYGVGPAHLLVPAPARPRIGERPVFFPCCLALVAVLVALGWLLTGPAAETAVDVLRVELVAVDVVPPGAARPRAAEEREPLPAPLASEPKPKAVPIPTHQNGPGSRTTPDREAPATFEALADGVPDQTAPPARFQPGVRPEASTLAPNRTRKEHDGPVELASSRVDSTSFDSQAAPQARKGLAESTRGRIAAPADLATSLEARELFAPASGDVPASGLAGPSGREPVGPTGSKPLGGGGAADDHSFDVQLTALDRLQACTPEGRQRWLTEELQAVRSQGGFPTACGGFQFEGNGRFEQLRVRVSDVNRFDNRCEALREAIKKCRRTLSRES